ncbi:hypothetical protein [Virgibacillus salexigens]|uniref:Uncharacterized protein n=1 Tax=Virgibacillus kapii TaxID=1638645 RepID=A0ABQ2DYA1_9BACI|nr:MULTISPECIES: hypothetical protein [Virgibacillus]MYL43934.1 hypothetical protein [Virgibacillus massiliensis]GGJ77010.1 hypothetical protein GCM10007111_43350 [Virgibacillus kapii]
MNRQLKNLKSNFEKKIPTTFTIDDKQRIFENIKDNTGKRRSSTYHVFPRIITGMAIITLVFIGFVFINSETPNPIGDGRGNASGPTETYKESIKEGQQERSIIEEELTVNGKSDPAKYPSNSHLYMAHLLAASLSGNTEVDNGGKPIDKEEIESTLEGVSEELSQIKYEGERKSELQNVIDLTDQAINSDPQKGDEILSKIHTILHELDNHFNTNPFIDS